MTEQHHQPQPAAPGAARQNIAAAPRSPEPQPAGQEPQEYYGWPQEDEANLEFRPVVKYTGVAVLLALLVGIEYATYEGGYSRGYHDAAKSGEVQASINRVAVENLRHFMQLASADDDTLLSAIATRDTTLAWIKEPSVRLEAEWMLVQSALDRDKAEDVTDFIAELFGSAPATEVWARRCLLAARNLAATADAVSARECYRAAIDRLAALGKADTRLVAMNELGSLLASLPDEASFSALDALQQEAAGLGDAGRLLRADILAYMGLYYREHGDAAASMRCFEESLAGVNIEETPALAAASVCYGLALMEKGDTAHAETLLREGVNRLGNSPADVSYMVSGLRDLARLEQQRGAADAALALLYRAEGAATNRIPGDNSFWGCLYDQRGWVNLLKGAHEAALSDFRSAIDRQGIAEDVLAQSLEGAGRCCIILGEADTAALYLGKSAELRERIAAHDVSSLGCVYLQLGHAQDMRGDSAAAAAAYARSAELLASSEQADDRENRISALMGRSYALGQLGQWAEAAALWEQVQPLVAGDAPRETEARNQLALCRRKLTNATAEDVSDVEAEPDEAPVPRRNTRRRRR